MLLKEERVSSVQRQTREKILGLELSSKQVVRFNLRHARIFLLEEVITKGSEYHCQSCEPLLSVNHGKQSGDPSKFYREAA